MIGKKIYKLCFCIILLFVFVSQIELAMTILKKVRRTTRIVQGYKLFTTIGRGNYCIGYNITKAKKSFRDKDGLEPISLAVHTTANYLLYLLDEVKIYDGPISVSVYLDHNTVGLLGLLLKLHECNAGFREKVSLHTVHERAAFEDECEPIIVAPNNLHCANLSGLYVKKEISKTVPPFRIYPINIMRNVARRGAPSHIHFVSDVEMVLSSGFATNAKKIVNRYINGGDKIAIAVRRFEIEDKVKVPRNIKDLKRLVDKKSAFEFHHEHFPQGHTIPGLWEWFRRSEKKDVQVYEIPYKGVAWEPQLILHSSDIYNEEDVPTRHRDQQVLAYELCRANYTFFLASHLFNIHRGVKKTSTHLEEAVKKHQGKLRYTLRKFITRINAQYPDKTTLAKCKAFIID